MLAYVEIFLYFCTLNCIFFMHRTDVPYNVKEEYDLKNVEGEYCYKAVSYHRNGTNGKARWTITVDEEIGLFVDAIMEDTIIGTNGWVLLIRDGQRIKVGVTANHEDSYIGRFRRSTDVEWHGYPGNYRGDVGDIPPGKVLQNWANNLYIRKSDILRIQTQKPCNL